MKLGKYSIGVGDRFGHQARAQLRACILAMENGVEVSPVWNKSNREHNLIGSEPAAVRQAAAAAVQDLEWKHGYFCDADHVTLQNVGRFLDCCDFFTIDVADSIAQSAPAAEQAQAADAFVGRHLELLSPIHLEGVDQSIAMTREELRKYAGKYLAAAKEAGLLYQAIQQARGVDNFVAEVSMDETDVAQTPAELLVILAALADEGVKLQTIAPKFSGRFNKGVDYVGNVARFEQEFALDVAAIAWAVKTYGLPENLKLSVHSGSDKFSIYPAIYAILKRFRAGVHLKTAGTTWLEELIGLAEGNGLELVASIYAEAYAEREELCVPYATVIDIDPAKLPTPEEVRGWTAQQFIAALRHDREVAAYNPGLRQLLHVAFPVAARKGDVYLKALDANEAVIARNVTENLYCRHIGPVFLGR